MQKIRLARGKQLLYLFDLYGPLKNDPSGAEVTAPGRANAILAEVCHRVLEHPGAAFRAGTEWSLT